MKNRKKHVLPSARPKIIIIVVIIWLFYTINYSLKMVITTSEFSISLLVTHFVYFLSSFQNKRSTLGGQKAVDKN